MDAYRSLNYAVEAAIARITLTGPGHGNALGPDFWRELPLVFDAIEKDSSVRAVVLEGAGDHFTYGLDLMAMMAELGPLLMGPQMVAGRTELLALIKRMQRATSAPERCSKPVIAAMHGWCIGGGIDLVTACDIRLCSADARFSVREVRLAMVADMGTLQRLPRIVGQGVARELALTGRDFDAAEAERIGLVNRVYPDPPSLVEGALALASEIAANPPMAVSGTKHLLNWSADHTIDEGLDYVATWNAAMLQSLDLTEAIQAFSEKRAPRFKGE